MTCGPWKGHLCSWSNRMSHSLDARSTKCATGSLGNHNVLRAADCMRVSFEQSQLTCDVLVHTQYGVLLVDQHCYLITRNRPCTLWLCEDTFYQVQVTSCLHLWNLTELVAAQPRPLLVKLGCTKRNIACHNYNIIIVPQQFVP